MAGTILFLGLSGAFAWLLWYDRPARAREDVWRLLRTVLIIGLPWAALVGAALMNNGDRLTVRITQLRVPLAAIAPGIDMAPRPYLVVGDRPEDADLVVAPYADQSLSRISMPPDPRRFVTVEAQRTRSGRGGETMTAQLRVQSFDSVPDLELPGMLVKLDGRVLAPGPPRPIELAPGRTRTVTIARLDLDGAPADRRTFFVTLRAGGASAVELNLQTPLVADAGSCEAPSLRLAPMISADAPEQSFRDPDNLVFGGLGAGGANPVLERSWLGPIGDASAFCTRSETSFSWPNGVSADDVRLRLVSQRAFVPWFCCVFVTICALALHSLCGPYWRQPSAERIVVPFLQWLMALRLLIAIAGYYNDVDQIPSTVLWDGMSAFLCVPVLAVLALRPGGGRALRPLLIGLALLVVSGIVAVQLRYPIAWLSIPTALCVVTLVAVVARLWLRSTEAPLARAAAFVGDWLAGERKADAKPAPPPEALLPDRAGDPGLAKRAVASWRARPAAWRRGTALVALLVLVRLALVGIDYISDAQLTERVGPIPLSLIYVPGTLLGFALLLHGARQMGERVALLSTLTAFLAAYIVVPILTRDAGAIFVCAWPVAGVIAWFSWLQPAKASIPRRLPWSLPLASPVLIVAFLGMINYIEGPIPSPAGPPVAPSPQPVGQGEASLSRLGPHIAEVARWDRNDVRLLAYFSPDAVEQLGTKYAFESLDMTTSLGPLTSRLFGRGYLAPSNVRRPLLTNQYYENLPAVHLIWPVGRLGTLGLLIVVVAGTVALRVPAAPHPAGLPDWRTLLAILARASFVWAALYMILANLNWVPFTGRNVYLLAVTSGGDLPEGFVLLMMMCAPLVRRPGAKAR